MKEQHANKLISGYQYKKNNIPIMALFATGMTITAKRVQFGEGFS